MTFIVDTDNIFTLNAKVQNDKFCAFFVLFLQRKEPENAGSKKIKQMFWGSEGFEGY